MAVYDKLDWHLDAAVEAGQPPENAFAHIGLYLAWLIRRDLHASSSVPAEYVEAVKRREMTGSDLVDVIDTKLGSHAMSAEGAAFSDARYSAYLTAFGELFNDEPDYGVADDQVAAEGVEPILDRLYEEWVRDGRPPAAEQPPLEIGAPVLTSAHVMLPPGFDEAQVAEMITTFGEVLVTIERASERPKPHVAPDLERLIPTDLTAPPMDVSSVRATEWRSSLLNRALKRLDVRPRDAVVVVALGGDGQETLGITVYGVPGVPAARLAQEFRSVLPRFPGSEHTERIIGGKVVAWTSIPQFDQATWARDGLVFSVGGRPADVERAIGRLP